MKNNKALETLKKGHLYFHTRLNRVERITQVDASGVVVHRHHAETKASLAWDFRKATAEEVKTYLGK